MAVLDDKVSSLFLCRPMHVSVSLIAYLVFLSAHD
jgi:hypothetical protein